MIRGVLMLRLFRLSKELRATLAMALKDSFIGVDPVDELRLRRDRKRVRT